jgi:hypothetical protein
MDKSNPVPKIEKCFKKTIGKDLIYFIEIIERLRPIICDTYGFDFYFGCVALEIHNVARICPDTADVLKNYF